MRAECGQIRREPQRCQLTAGLPLSLCRSAHLAGENCPNSPVERGFSSAFRRIVPGDPDHSTGDFGHRTALRGCTCRCRAMDRRPDLRRTRNCAASATITDTASQVCGHQFRPRYEQALRCRTIRAISCSTFQRFVLVAAHVFSGSIPPIRCVARKAVSKTFDDHLPTSSAGIFPGGPHNVSAN